MNYFETVGFQRDFARMMGAFDKLNGHLEKLANPPEMVTLTTEQTPLVGPCCECAYWDDYADKRGACHRRSPQVGEWPVTNEFDWCGEWERDRG